MLGFPLREIDPDDVLRFIYPRPSSITNFFLSSLLRAHLPVTTHIHAYTLVPVFPLSITPLSSLLSRFLHLSHPHGALSLTRALGAHPLARSSLFSLLASGYILFLPRTSSLSVPSFLSLSLPTFLFLSSRLSSLQKSKECATTYCQKEQVASIANWN